ncbi:pyridoxal phosphate-dependent aminotransferase [Chloroflexota bacterium]
MKRKGLDIIELQTGDPDFTTPNHIIQAAYEAMQQGYTHYVSSRGLLELREVIEKKLWNENRIKSEPEGEILITPGAIHAVFAAISATINPGDEVIIPDPCWVAYPGCIALSGGIAVRIPCQKGSLEIDMERLNEAITPRTKLLILNYPSNPTGMSLTLDQLKYISKLSIKHNLLVLADEIYEKILYKGSKHYSIASIEGMGERTITINGFSKTYAMTGWRIGYACANKRIIAQMLKVQQYSVTCANAFVQKAALVALKGSQECVQNMVEEYDKRRQLIIVGLNEIDGISCPQPQGTFYAFADISQLGMSAIEAADFLLDRAKVGVVPGSAYGPSGENYLRFSFANSMENIEKALQRIEKVITEWRR